MYINTFHEFQHTYINAARELQGTYNMLYKFQGTSTKTVQELQCTYINRLQFQYTYINIFLCEGVRILTHHVCKVPLPNVVLKQLLF